MSTRAEVGYKNFDVSERKVRMAPTGTPAAVVERLNKKVQKALAQPSTIAYVLAIGSLPMTSSVAQAQRSVMKELYRWGAVIRESGRSKSH